MSKLQMINARNLAMCVGLAAGVAFAEPPQQPNNQDRTSSPGMSAPRDMSRTESRAPVSLVRVKKILGEKVTNPSGETLGEVENLLIGNRSGRVEYVVMSHGGALGVGGKKVAVPYDAFTWNYDTKGLSLSSTKAELDRAPEAKSDDWRYLSDDSTAKGLRSYYRVTRDHPAVDPDRPATRSSASEEGYPFLTAKKLEGQDIKSDTGSDLGSVKDIVIDAASGRVAFVAVSFGGLMGVGDKIVPVPWYHFDINNEGKIYGVRMDAEKIKNAPRFDNDEWKELNQPGYPASVYSHYGYEARWLNDAGSPTSSSMGTYPEYDRLYTSGESTIITGQIVSVDKKHASGNMPETTCVTVRTTDNNEVKVHLAPASYMDAQDLRLKTGDPLSVKGRWAQIDGTRYILASEVTPPNGKVVTLRRPDGTRTWAWR